MTHFSETSLAQIFSPICPLHCHNLLRPTTGESSATRPRWQKRSVFSLTMWHTWPLYLWWSHDTRSITHTEGMSWTQYFDACQCDQRSPIIICRELLVLPFSPQSDTGCTVPWVLNALSWVTHSCQTWTPQLCKANTKVLKVHFLYKLFNTDLFPSPKLGFLYLISFLHVFKLKRWKNEIYLRIFVR